MDDGMLQARLRREGVQESSVVEGPRQRDRPDFFSASKYARWSEFDMARLNGRHDAIRIDIEDVLKAEPLLSRELEELYSRVHAAVSPPDDARTSGVSSSDELEAEMAHVGAACLQASLMELLAASTDEEVPHLWNDDAAAAMAVRARLGDVACGAWGELAIAPPLLIFRADGVAGAACEPDQCGGCEVEPQVLSWPLASFVGVDDDADEHARCELRLLSGEDDGLLFALKRLCLGSGDEFRLGLEASGPWAFRLADHGPY